MDFFGAREIVLHPLGGAFLTKPNEAGKRRVMRISGKELVVESEDRTTHGCRGAGERRKRGDKLTNREGHSLRICGRIGVQDGCRRFLPVLLAGSAVADEHIANGAPIGDIVGVVLIVNMLQTRDTGG